MISFPFWNKYMKCVDVLFLVTRNMPTTIFEMFAPIPTDFVQRDDLYTCTKYRMALNMDWTV